MGIVVRPPEAGESGEAAGWPIWTCAPSSFEWNYDSRERCLILEGEAVVESESLAQPVRFGAGDWVVFPKGLSCRWTVLKAVRKHYAFGD